jgi:hypothetical protein
VGHGSTVPDQVDDGEIDVFGEGEDVSKGGVLAGIDDPSSSGYLLNRLVQVFVVAEIGRHLARHISIRSGQRGNTKDTIHPPLEVEYPFKVRRWGRPVGSEQDLLPEGAFETWFTAVTASVLYETALPEVAKLSRGHESVDLTQNPSEEGASAA